MSRLLAGLLCAAVALSGCMTTSSSSGRDVDSASAADANVKLGVAYMSQGNLALAKEKLERAEKQDPKSADAQFALAELYSRLQQPKDAEKAYRNAMTLAPDKLEVVNGYAVFLCSTGETDRGIAQFERLMNNPLYDRQAAAAANAGRCLRDQKRHADSIRFFETALAKQPDWLDAVVQLADVQIQLGNPDQALKVIDNYQTMRNSATALVVGVRAAVAKGDCTVAGRYVRKLRAEFGNSRETLSLLPQVIGTCRDKVSL